MATPTEDTYIRLREYEKLEAQLRAMTSAERLMHDDRDRLERDNQEWRAFYSDDKVAAENHKLRQDLEKLDNELLAEIAAKDEARAIAGGLLRLARAQDAYADAKERAYLDDYERWRAVTAAAWKLREALAALHPGVRGLVEE